MILFEKIQEMDIDELAKFMTELHCEECSYPEDYKNCDMTNCWCHKSNNYRMYADRLLREVDNK